MFSGIMNKQNLRGVKCAFWFHFGHEDPTILCRENLSGASLEHDFRSIIHVGLCDGAPKRGAEVFEFLQSMSLGEAEMNKLSDSFLATRLAPL